MESMNRGKSLDRAPIALLFFAAGMLLPLTASAHDGDYGGLILGGLAGLLLAAAVVTFLPVRIRAKLLLFLPLTLLFIVIGGRVGAGITEARQQARNNQNHEREREFRENPLFLSACENRISEVNNILAAATTPVVAKSIGFVVSQCTMGEPKRPELFGILMQRLVAYQWALTDASNHDLGYCNILVNLHRNRDIDYLQLLRNRNLPITCETKGLPVWWEGLENGVRGDAESWQKHQGKTYEWLVFLKTHQVKLRESFPNQSSYRLLNRVIEHHSADIVLLALEEGGEPYIRPDKYTAAPVHVWTLRRFHSCDGCPRRAYYGNLSEQDIVRINAKLRPMSADEVNFQAGGNGETILHRVHDFENSPDGGAAFFAYLIANGANLGYADYRGAGFLHMNKTISPQLLNELQKLSDAPVQDMAFPAGRRPESRVRSKGTPLLEAARKNGNTELVEFLCGRGVGGCSK